MQLNSFPLLPDLIELKGCVVVSKAVESGVLSKRNLKNVQVSGPPALNLGTSALAIDIYHTMQILAVKKIRFDTKTHTRWIKHPTVNYKELNLLIPFK